MTRSSSAARSSMTRLYLQPLPPPGCTLPRSPPRSAVTPSASINFLTSTPALGVTARSISGCDETDIYILRYCIEIYAVTPTPGSVAVRRLRLLRTVLPALPGTTALSRRRPPRRSRASPSLRRGFPAPACRSRTEKSTLPRFRRSSSSRRALHRECSPARTLPVLTPPPNRGLQASPADRTLPARDPARVWWRKSPLTRRLYSPLR